MSCESTTTRVDRVRLLSQLHHVASLSSELRDRLSKGKGRRGVIAKEQVKRALLAVYEDTIWSGQIPESYRLRASVVILTGLLCTLYRPAGLPYVLLSAKQARDLSEDETTGILEVMRETALKCISFVGVPRIINCLAALSAGLEKEGLVLRRVSNTPRRSLQPDNVADTIKRGEEYWEGVYTVGGLLAVGERLAQRVSFQPYHQKLVAKLGEYHPDLPVHILECHYGALLAPVRAEDRRPSDLDRILSSVLAVTCLRAQSGVEKQVESHVFGLRKAEKACERSKVWLTTDDGCVWLLDTIDHLVELLASP